MSNTLNLDASGSNGCTPDQDPWEPNSGPVTITNSTSVTQTLFNITPGLLVPTDRPPAPANTISVPTTGWSGTVGRSSGTYNYEDGLPEAGVRTGTIDPG